MDKRTEQNVKSKQLGTDNQTTVTFSTFNENTILPGTVM